MTARTGQPGGGNNPVAARGRQARRRGRRAEILCRWWLRFKGYRILAANWRCPQGEIDIVARRGSVLAFVEVKARRDPMAAGEAVTAEARRRLSGAAAAFLAAHRRLNRLAIRFDVMMVTPGRPPAHCADAWRTD